MRRLRGDFPPRAASPLVSRGSSATKKVPRSRQLRRLQELAHPICLYFVAIFCHGTKQNNASSKTKVKTALVVLTKTPSFLQMKDD